MPASAEALRRRRDAARERYNNDPEYRAAVLEYQREYARKQRQDPEYRARRKAARKPIYSMRYRLKKEFGLTVEDYEQLHETQGGKCAVCGRPENGRRLDVDHCHTTGKIRGLLCNPCNQSLGLLGESPERIKGLLAYLGAES